MSDRTVQSISCHELHRIWKSGEPVELIDVRPHEDFEALHAEFARSVPFAALDPVSLMATRSLPAEASLYIICQVGVRSVDACLRFIDRRKTCSKTLGRRDPSERAGVCTDAGQTRPTDKEKLSVVVTDARWYTV